MEKLVLLMIWVVTCAAALQGNSLKPRKDPSRCGDWTPYKDEKCFKIVVTAGHQTQQDAEIVCEALSEDLKRESYPRLITIKSKEEQKFLEHFLFVENKTFNSVWLGLKEIGNSGKFQWNDGSDVIFSNWLNQTVSDKEHHCVEMESGWETNPVGVWSRVACVKENIVVCERTQTWTLETLQNMFLNYKLEQEQQKEELENKLKNYNFIPLGFIYVQMANQEPPTSLWPTTKWIDVSSNYSGLFFRVAGGNAAQFGQTQEGSSPKLTQVEYRIGNGEINPISIPTDGSWSQYIFSGESCGNCLSQRFRLSGEEVRPRNQAIRIWQRIQ